MLFRSRSGASPAQTASRSRPRRCRGSRSRCNAGKRWMAAPWTALRDSHLKSKAPHHGYNRTNPSLNRALLLVGEPQADLPAGNRRRHHLVAEGECQRRAQRELRQPHPLSAGGCGVQLCGRKDPADRLGGGGRGHGAEAAGVWRSGRQLEPGWLVRVNWQPLREALVPLTFFARTSTWPG